LESSVDRATCHHEHHRTETSMKAKQPEELVGGE
jgi:hypothetical protein